jgi:hypothetical protein
VFKKKEPTSEVSLRSREPILAISNRISQRIQIHFRNGFFLLKGLSREILSPFLWFHCIVHTISKFIFLTKFVLICKFSSFEIFEFRRGPLCLWADPCYGSTRSFFVAAWWNTPRGRCCGIRHGDDTKTDQMLLAVVWSPAAFSQAKSTTAKLKNLKFSKENEFFKKNKYAPCRLEMCEKGDDIIKRTSKSRETIPLIRSHGRKVWQNT